MYALVNVVFGFPLGRIKRNGRVGKNPKYYASGKAVTHAYNKLTPLQQCTIIPALINADDTYTRIDFSND